MDGTRNHCSLDAVEGSIEHTCATCDNYEYGWDGHRELPCGLCGLKWRDLAGFSEFSVLSMSAASLCIVEKAGACDEWVEADADD